MKFFGFNMVKDTARYDERVCICLKLFIFIEKSYVQVDSGAGMVKEYRVVCSYASSDHNPAHTKHFIME